MEDCSKYHVLPMDLGTGPYRRLHKNIRVQPSPIQGKGIFAMNGMIPKGAVVFHESTEKFPNYTWEEVQNFSEEEKGVFYRLCLQFQEGLFQGPRTEEEAEKEVALFWNHSCDPNCWYLNDDLTIARRDIQEGEELTLDYCTFEKESTFNIRCLGTRPCRCGAQDCRGVLKYDDYKDEKFRNKYYPHLASHLLEEIEVYLAEQEKTKNPSS